MYSFPLSTVPGLCRSMWRRRYVGVAAPQTRPAGFCRADLTGFYGIPETFDTTDPVGARLLLAEPAVTAIMRLPTTGRSRIAALRAVIRARDTFARAPKSQRSALVPTSWLLARFQDYLNVGRRDASSLVLERLRSELRLDALNVKFLEVQLLAAFEEWTGIVALPEFPSLCVARRTPAITVIFSKHCIIHTSPDRSTPEVWQTRARRLRFRSGLSYSRCLSSMRRQDCGQAVGVF